MARTQGVGVLPRDLAVNAGITGPMLRASGVNYDIRKVDKYGIYGRFNFRVPLGEHGDVYDRYMIRMLEMRESLEDSGAGAARHPRRADHGPQGQAARFPAQGRARPMGASKARRANWAFISSATAAPNPYRYRVRPPSFINLTILEDMCLGSTVADVVVILGSVDIVLGEVDR